MRPRARRRSRRLVTALVGLGVAGALLPAGYQAATVTPPAAQPTPNDASAPATPAPMASPPSASAHGTPPHAAPAPAQPGPTANEHWTPYSHWLTDRTGKTTAQYYADPHFRLTPSGWQTIDTTIRHTEDSGLPLSADGALVPMRFGATASRLLELQLDRGTVDLGIPGGATVAPVQTGDEVVYAGIEPGVDLRYQLSASGVKEEIVLHSAAAAHDVQFTLSDPAGLLGAGQSQKDGSVVFSSAIAPGVRLRLPAPVVTSSGGKALTSRDPGSAAMAVKQVPGGYKLDVAASPSWLDGRAFPVVIDPTLQFISDQNGGLDVYGDANCPTCSTIQNGNLQAGSDGSTSWRTFIQFGDLGLPPDAMVSTATLNLYRAGCLSGSPCAIASGLDVEQMDGAWDGSTPMGQLTSLESAALVVQAYAGDGTTGIWHSFDASAMLNDELANGGSDTGFAIQQDVEAAGTGGALYDSGRNANTSLRPYLSVTWMRGCPTQSLAQGYAHSMATDYDSDVYTWGDNNYGELGIGSVPPNFNYTPQDLNTFDPYTRTIATGWYHSLSLMTDGTVRAWGQNGSGQVGNGTTNDQWSPQQVGGLSGMTAVAGGYDWSMALDGNGNVWTWGDNMNGELGVATNSGTLNANPSPMQVTAVSNVVAISAGEYHALVLKSDGTVWTWGDNSHGELGQNTQDYNPHPAPVQVSSLSNIIAVSAGVGFSMALGADGTVWEWGDNYAGKLGTGIQPSGTFADQYLPARVLQFSQAASVVAGGDSAFATRQDGSGWAWGDNFNGELGAGQLFPPGSGYTGAAAPTRITGLPVVTSLAAGEQETQGADTSGNYYYWGHGVDGTSSTQFAPVQHTVSFSGAPASCPAVPGAPPSVIADPGNTQAGVTWSPPTGGGPVSQYTVRTYPGGAPTTVSSLSPWQTSGSPAPTVTTAQAHSGTYSAQVGFTSVTTGPNDLYAVSMQQAVAVPTTSPVLSFWYWPYNTSPPASGSSNGNYQQMEIRDLSGNVLATPMSTQNGTTSSNAQSWVHVQYPLAQWAGQTVVLWFGTQRNGTLTQVYMDVDDVSLGNGVAQTLVPSGDFEHFSTTVNGLANSSTYQFTVTGVNESGQGAASALSNAITPPGAPGLLKVVSTLDGVTKSTYSSGDQVQYTVRLSDPAGSPPLVVSSFQDTMPSLLSLAGMTVSINGEPCNTATSPTSCAVSGQTLSISGLSVQPDVPVSVVYDVVAEGVDRGCASDSNVATITSSTNQVDTVSAPITVCDTGLGLESWWSYEKQAIGPQGEADVNAANGNLVIQQTDGVPVQAHGRLAFVLRRYYNSEQTTAATTPGSIGAGWKLSVDSGGALDDETAAGNLYIPTAQSLSNPLGISLVDRDGTHHLFTPRQLGAALSVDVTAGLGTPLSPRALQADPGYQMVVDELFDPPAGVHLGMWRYSEVPTTCGTSCVEKILGYAAERPDRVRYEFASDGRMLDMVDGSGVELRYVYEAVAPLGGQFPRLVGVYEPRSCSWPPAAGCRAFQFGYPDSQTINVTDPMGERTVYHLDTAQPQHLVQVDNPDGSQLHYTYGGCGGSVDQLCSAGDPRGSTVSFTYSAATIGPARIASVKDRRGNAATYTYSSSSVSGSDLTVDKSGERHHYLSIDSSGRAGEVDEGDTSNNVLRRANYFWDAAGSTCTQPVAKVDNDLCSVVRASLSTSTPNETTASLYDEQGQVLRQRRNLGTGSLDSTNGYHLEYFNADGSVLQYDDVVQGGGAVASTPASGGRGGPLSLFATADHTQALSPNGNAATAFATYLTTYHVDDNPAVAPNVVPAATVCNGPNGTNTGLVCEVDAPQSGSGPAVTRYTYDSFGQKSTMTTPDAVAGTSGTRSYGYTYYQDTDRDLSGTVSAGGWLKAVTDPTGNFVAFAYDAAGHVVRTWDRNATQGHVVGDFPGSAGAPTDSQFAETLYGSGGDTTTSPFSSPWRYAVQARDALGNLTTYTLDANGNQTTIRPPRGNLAGNASYDVTQAFDAADERTSVLMPAEAAASKPTGYAYDANGNPTSVTDPDGNVQTTQYDAVNRAIGHKWTRGVWPTDGSQPANCVDSATTDAPIPAGRILCTSNQSYDGVDNVLTSTDGNRQVTTMTYDDAHRLVRKLSPRNDGVYGSLETDYLYDADGNTTDTCPPREFTEGTRVCSSTAPYSTHATYDPSDHLLTQSTFRSAGGSADTWTYTYDGDGNRITAGDPNGHTTTYGYDLLDRLTSTAVPRDQATSNTTTDVYDPVGNLTAVVMPASTTVTRVTAYSYDADNRLVDTVEGADNQVAGSAGVPDAAGGVDVRTRNLYDADGHVVGQLLPSAFAGSVSSPNPAFMTRTDYDVDGRVTAKWLPRYDSAAHSDLGLSSTQTAQCPTGAAPQAIGGVPSYPSTVGVCVMRYAYDAAGNVTQVRMPTSNGSDDRFITFTPTDDRLVASMGGPSPVTAGAQVTVASYLYDATGRRTKITDALSHVTTTSYSADGLTLQTTGQPNGTTTHVTSYTYDANGNQVSTTDPLSGVSRQAFTTDNLPASSTDPVGDTTTYAYDAAGNPTQVASPDANAHDAANSSATPTTNTFTFDNLLLTATQPVSADGSTRRQVTYAYDSGGRKTSEQTATVNAQGVPSGLPTTQSFSYYNDDRLQTETGRDGSTITHTYDPAGRPTSVTDGTSNTTLTSTFYLDELPRTVDDGTWTSRYGYDGMGQTVARAQRNDGSGAQYTTSYAYNDAELASSLSSSLVSGSASWTYDSAGKPLTETEQNGQKLTYTYNADDTLASLALANSTGTSLASWSYTYDGDYRITDQNFSGVGGTGGSLVTGDFHMAYDAASRVTSFTAGAQPAKSITYDHDGNRLTYGTQSFTYNADDSIASFNSGTGFTAGYSYTPFGALQSDGCLTYAYDGFDRLTSATAGATPGCSSTSSTYSYDGLDRQHTAGATTLHYDGLNPQQADESTGGVDTLDELTPGGTVRALLRNPASVSVSYLADDGQGDTTAVTDSGANVQCTARFDPWGGPTGAQSATNVCDTGSTANDLWYRGARRDSATGNYQFGSRTYDPSKGSFLTPDSYRQGGSAPNLSVGVDPLTQNRYSYVNGDPVNLVDPNGHNPCSYDACTPDQNRALAASDRGASNAGPPAKGRTYHSGPRDPQKRVWAKSPGLAIDIDTATGWCLDCADPRTVDGRTYVWNDKIGTWVCGQHDAPGSSCDESHTYMWNGKSIVEYDDGIRTGWHKVLSTVASVVVGVVVGVGCTVATGGSAALACAIAGGAAAGAVGGAMDCGLKCAAIGAVIGGITGGAAYGAGKVLMAGVESVLGSEVASGVRSVLSRALSRGSAEAATDEVPAFAGSGPAPGVIEIGPRAQSTGAFAHYSGNSEFVFDPATSRLAVGRAPGIGSPHQELAGVIDAGPDVVGGMMRGGGEGTFFTNENSGHFGENWNDEVRQQFIDFMNGNGFDVYHSQWPG